MKVYLVIGSSGEWEDYRQCVVGVYATKELAEANILEFNKDEQYREDKYDIEEREVEQ